MYKMNKNTLAINELAIANREYGATTALRRLSDALFLAQSHGEEINMRMIMETIKTQLK